MSAEFARKLFYFPTPEISESFNFEKCFHCSAGEESVGQYVKDLTINRDKLKASLHTSNDHNSASLLADIDAYMPLIWQLLDSLDRQEPVKIETPLRFVWKGAIIRGFSKIDSTVFTDVIFEVIMTLHTKAIVTANLAAELSESDPSAVNTAAKYLRQSSSIMKYLASSLIPRWHTKINYRLTPSETNVTYCAYLSEFFSACSNQMCVAKAMQNGSTPPTLLTSLCLSVVRGMETCLNNLQTSGVILKDTDSGSRDHVGVMRYVYLIAHALLVLVLVLVLLLVCKRRFIVNMFYSFFLCREFFSVLVYRYQADTYMKSHDTGIVIALCAVVQARINSTSDSKHFDPFKPAQFPKISHQSPGLRSALAEVGDFIARMRAVAEEENKLVYFKAVPHDTSQLPELPAPTILNLPSEPFNPPSSEVSQVVFGRYFLYTCIIFLYYIINV